MLDRRRALMAQEPAAGGYITDGLVFHLDGLIHDESSWMDTVGLKTFSPVSGTTYSWNNGLVISGGAFISSSAPIQYGTIEVVYTQPTLATAIIAMVGNNSSVATGSGKVVVYSDGTFGFPAQGGANNGKTYTNATGQHYIAFNGTTAFANGAEASLSNKTHSFGSFSSVMEIGRNSDKNYKFSGTIHAIRVYNRALSAAEIAYNYSVDVDRFGL